MYNGIGLRTPRGSGTSGYVQRNLSFVPPLRKKYEPERETPTKPHRLSDDVLLHRERRGIEVACAELEDELRQKGEDEITIAKLVAELRARRLKALEGKLERSRDVVLRVEKDREMARLKDAFGIVGREGDAFRFAESTRKRQERETREANEELERHRRRLYR